MALFSERYGYKKISDVIIREKITPEIQNAICSCFDKLQYILSNCGIVDNHTKILALEQHIWTRYLNQRLNDYDYNQDIIIEYIKNLDHNWYQVLDIVEFSVKYLYRLEVNSARVFCNTLNDEFERLNFAYRVIKQEIVEITSEQEIKAVEDAIDESPRNIQIHLNCALEKLAQRPNGDYRNSIKESISAVEAFCREKTGERTLGKALSELEKKNIIIPQSLKSAFSKLYEYTNHADTGIRHALMDDEGTYTPTADEALFMLVSCSAFINYLSKKVQ